MKTKRLPHVKDVGAVVCPIVGKVGWVVFYKVDFCLTLTVTYSINVVLSWPVWFSFIMNVHLQSTLHCMFPYPAGCSMCHLSSLPRDSDVSFPIKCVPKLSVNVC